jgi:hypothetical protein
MRVPILSGKSPLHTRWVRRAAYGSVALLVVAGVAVVQLRTRTAAGADAPAGTSAAAKTVAVVRTEMSNGRVLPGALGYGTARPVKGSRLGVVTWLPAAGTLVKRGEQLYRVNDEPVSVFYGGIPLFRTLRERNTVGRDVRVVADNLKALGYAIGDQPRVGSVVRSVATADSEQSTTDSAPADPVPPVAPATAPATVRVTVRDGDGVLTDPLISAIKKWQRDRGVTTTGVIGAGDVVVLEGQARVDSVAMQTGDNAVGTLMSVTPTVKVITVSAEVAQASTIKQGDNVTVTLPDQKEAPGTVTAVGTAAQTPEGASGGSNAAPKLTVTVALDDAEAVTRLDSAEVQVEFATQTHADVLVVPVGALIALSEGGYGVQIAGGGLVAVRTGLFAKGLVEVSGAGLNEGTKVVTTS